MNRDVVATPSAEITNGELARLNCTGASARLGTIGLSEPGRAKVDSEVVTWKQSRVGEAIEKKGQQEGCSLNVLVIDEWLPFPPDSGKRVRTWNILRRLARRHRITLLCYGREEDENAEVLRRAGIDVHTVRPLSPASGLDLYLRLLANCASPYPYSVAKHYTYRFQDRLRALLGCESFDLVHYEWSPYARYADGVAEVPRLIVAHNVESEIWLRRAQRSKGLLERLFFSFQAKKMEQFERRVLRKAECVVVVTRRDLARLEAWGMAPTMLVENGVDPDEFVPGTDPVAADEILCLGALDWHPNLDAARHFLDEIYPLILAQRPATRLRIVGRCPPPELRKRVAEFPGMELVDQVADVRPHLARAAVVVVPLRIGGGSRIKILEALAMGKPVVSSSVGAEGLDLQDGVHLAIADSAFDFASRTVEMLASPGESRRLGENGRKLVTGRYGWDRAANAMDQAWWAAVAPTFSPDLQIAVPAPAPEVQA
jgi:sugar transferase (PEP-CTERM/EpsH1 system associated)